MLEIGGVGMGGGGAKRGGQGLKGIFVVAQHTLDFKRALFVEHCLLRHSHIFILLSSAPQELKPAGAVVVVHGEEDGGWSRMIRQA